MSIAGYNENKTKPIKGSLACLKPMALDDTCPAVESPPRQGTEIFHKNKSSCNE